MSKSKSTKRVKSLSINIEGLDELELISKLKEYLLKSKSNLERAFNYKNNISEIVLLRANHIDDLLKAIWKYFALSKNISLIAVGGYGRGELHPHSDIDLLILNHKKISTSDSKKIEKLLTLLWDVGLIIGHSVRDIQQCKSFAKDDLTIATSLMEARLITGDSNLFKELMYKTSPSSIWNASDFYNAKVLEKKERYEKFDGSSYDLEPNLKSSPGGLRDIHLVAWIAQRCYFPKTLVNLIKENIISKREYYALIKCQLFLWKVRFALHTVSGKADDRLLFDYQKQVAELMGFKKNKGTLAVERLMQRYYRSVIIIRNITELLVELMKEGLPKNLSKKKDCQVINDDYKLIDKRVHAINPKIFSKKPDEILNVFQVLASNSDADGLSAKTMRAIRAARPKINNNFRKKDKHKKQFIDFWSLHHHSARAMFLMKRSGVLSDYLPVFRKISGQMQYDMFHSYTVDEHTLFLIRNLAEFTNQKNKIQFPHCHEIMTRQSKPQLIYLAGLFHDIGKGRGGDHSEIGEALAITFCQQHNVPDEDTKIISWLVANHLIMSLTSQKQDTSDHKVISNFAKLVGNKQKLELLYLLTVADIRATNKSLWNSWKDALLKDLYLNTLELLESQHQTPLAPNKSLWDINRETTRATLLEQDYNAEEIDSLWELLGDHYFSKRSVDAVVWQTKIVLNARDDETMLVGIRRSGERNSNEIFVYTKDKPNLFANLTSTLNQQGLNIYGAHIYTDRNGYCYDSFFFLNDNDKIVKDIDFENRIISEIKNNLANDVTQKVSRRMARQIKHFEVDTKVEITTDEFSPHTRVDIVAKNKPGFLASVGKAFVKSDIKLHDAKITTLGERAEDSFFITDFYNKPIKDDETLNIIKKNLHHYLN